MDRFALRFSLGYVVPQEEVAILTDQRKSHPVEDISPCATLEDVLALKKQVQEIAVPVIAHRMVMDPQARFSGRTAEGVVGETC
jgi:MoxR-like ATPase